MFCTTYLESPQVHVEHKLFAAIRHILDVPHDNFLQNITKCKYV